VQILLTLGIGPPNRRKGEEKGSQKITGRGLAMAKVQNNYYHYLSHPQHVSHQK